MQTLKEIVHDIAEHLPEQATFDDAMYALYVRQKLEKGLRDIEDAPTRKKKWNNDYWANALHGVIWSEPVNLLRV